MKKTKYFYCAECQSITASTGSIEITCCGRKLTPLTEKKANESEKLTFEVIDGERYFTSDHPMTKEHYILFAVFSTSESTGITNLYPEWNFSLRLPVSGHGKLLWCCTQHGLFYMNI